MAERVETTDVELMAGLLDARFGCDARGRMLSGRDATVSVPRFCLARTAHGNLWRFRADLSRDSVRSLSRLAAREGLGLESVPERAGALAQILGGSDAPSRAAIVCLTESTSASEGSGGGLRRVAGVALLEIPWRERSRDPGVVLLGDLFDFQ